MYEDEDIFLSQFLVLKIDLVLQIHVYNLWFYLAVLLNVCISSSAINISWCVPRHKDILDKAELRLVTNTFQQFYIFVALFCLLSFSIKKQDLRYYHLSI